MPNSCKKHTAKSDARFPVTEACFDLTVTVSELRKFVRLDQRIDDLNEKRIEVSASPRNTGRL